MGRFLCHVPIINSSVFTGFNTTDYRKEVVQCLHDNKLLKSSSQMVEVDTKGYYKKGIFIMDHQQLPGEALNEDALLAPVLHYLPHDAAKKPEATS